MTSRKTAAKETKVTGTSATYEDHQMWFIGDPHCEVLMWEILLLAHGPTKNFGESGTTMGFPQSIHRR